MPDLVAWVVGYSVAALGGVPAKLFLKRYRGEQEPPAVPAWLTGLLERFFFATLIAFRFSSVVIAMMAWLTLKLAANWGAEGRFSGTDASPEEIARLRLTAIVAGLISMFFAAIGGLVIRT